MADSFIPFGAAIDVVGVYDLDGFQQVFPQARPMKAIVREPTKLMEYPVEVGVTLSDHRIILQTTIELPVMISAANYRTTYNQIKTLRNNSTLLAVQTRTGLYQNMIIEDMPHEEDPERYSVIYMALKFREVLYRPDPAEFDPENESDEDTSLNGQQSVTDKAYPDSTNTKASYAFTGGGGSFGGKGASGSF